jgi:hypothetical protein
MFLKRGPGDVLLWIWKLALWFVRGKKFLQQFASDFPTGKLVHVGSIRYVSERE